jgi:hypothetical protein
LNFERASLKASKIHHVKRERERERERVREGGKRGNGW